MRIKPLLIFLIFLIYLNLLSLGTIHWLVSTSIDRNGYIRVSLVLNNVTIEIPSDWFATSSTRGVGMGLKQTIMLIPLHANVSITVIAYDNNAADEYLRELNVSTVEKSVEAEILNYFNRLNQSSQKLTLQILERGSRKVCNATAVYEIFLIKEAGEEWLKGSFLSVRCNGLIQVIYLGTKEAWNDYFPVYDHLLSTVR